MYETLAIMYTLLVAYLATWIHLIAIRRTSRIQSIPLLTLIILGAHMIEIQVYALSYHFISLIDGFGCVVDSSGECVHRWFDLTYYSAAVYTTLGFGDLVPVGPIRILTVTESLVGLALIAWTATFTFTKFSDTPANNLDPTDANNPINLERDQQSAQLVTPEI